MLHLSILQWTANQFGNACKSPAGKVSKKGLSSTMHGRFGRNIKRGPKQSLILSG
jgi:hypothetical protein